MIETIEDIVAGGCAGAIGTMVGIPFDTVKVRMQSLPNKFVTTSQTFLDTIKYEGFFTLFRGWVAPVSSQIFVNATTFAGESVASRFLENNEYTKGYKWNTFLSGSFGGFVQCFILSPVELIKCKMQVDCISENRLYKNVIDCTKQTIQKDGFLGLYRGIWVTTLRETPSYGVYFYIYRTVQELLTPKDQSFSAVATLIAGGCAGSSTWISIYPIDVIKSIIQTSPINTPKSELTMLYVARKILKERGIRFFFHGLGVTVIRAFPVNAATFYFYELFKKYFFHIR